MSIIDSDKLRKEIYNVMNEVIDTLNGKIDDGLKLQHKLEERIKCLEAIKMKDNSYITEAMIDEYRHEGYDRMKDDEADLVDEMLKCFHCGGDFAESEMDMVNGEWYCQCCEEEINKCGHEDMKDDIQEDN